jgi:hypothetical protein
VIASTLVNFLDEFYPDWTKKVAGYAGDGASVNGVRSRENTAVKNPKHTNVATILQRTLDDRGIKRRLLTSWCGAHRNALVWKHAWQDTTMLARLEIIMKKALPATPLPALDCGGAPTTKERIYRTLAARADGGTPRGLVAG